MSEFRDLAPGITRQRLVVEGYPAFRIEKSHIHAYLATLSGIAGMTPLIPPVTHRSTRYGWAGWIHWETSGAHFYAWDDPLLFFSVDVYTCKAFDPSEIVAFTAAFFTASDIVAKEF